MSEYSTTPGWQCRRCLKLSYSVTWMTDGSGPYCDECAGQKNVDVYAAHADIELSHLRADNARLWGVNKQVDEMCERLKAELAKLRKDQGHAE